MKEDNAEVRIHTTGKHNYPDEEYFVAHLLEKPQKLEHIWHKPCQYGLVHCLNVMV
jgi:hypothetical protein